MSSNVSKALQNLNQATGDRQYDIRQNGDRYTLLMPLGMGEYPSTTEGGMVSRLVGLRIAAEGRAKL